MVEADLEEFRLLRPLGRGGMGEVYLGHDTVLDRPVAIKLVATEAGNRERFLMEARAIARLSHPNVVTIYRVGTTATGQPFIVQELIRGTSLDQVSRPMPWRELCELAIGIARGLDAAHRCGVLHRDVKPANVMRDERGVARLLDFGVAKLSGGGQAPAPTIAARPSAADDVDATRDLPGAPGESAIVITAGASPMVAHTQPGLLIGTPRYAAPELWRGEPASPRSDLYSLGVLCYELATSVAPFPQTDVTTLEAAVLGGDIRPIEELAAVPGELARLVHRCLAQDPDARPSSAAELAHALETIGAAAPETPEGNPYRGLAAFDAVHRGLFFGRGPDIRALLDRMRAEPLLVVVGDSGIGKSSVCAAGVEPAVLAGALGDGRRWRAVRVVPGRTPWLALVDALGMDADASPEQLVATLGRAMRAEPAGTLLVIDQLEELVTASDLEGAARVARVLAAIGNGIPGIKALLAVRGDFLTRVAALPALGEPLTGGVYLLRVLARDDLREAIVGPARIKGVAFESPELVEQLVDAVAETPGALPLLQFTLAELWQARDREHARITARALAALGGVDGALAGHADAVLRTLPADERAAARRILLRLVTTERTRAIRDRDELAAAEPASARALEVLVRGRLVVARDSLEGTPTYELAHEALIRGWGTLRDLLDAEVGQHAARNRLVAAAAEWERLGRQRELLWSRRQLHEIEAVERSAKEEGFVLASRRQARRRWLARAALIAALPVSAGITVAVVRYGAARERRAEIETRVVAATAHRIDGDRLAAEAARARVEAFAAFDAGADGEPRWEAARQLGADAADRYRAAAGELEVAFLIDAIAVREHMADVLVAQARLASAELDSLRFADVLGRLEAHDPVRMTEWRRPATLVVELDQPATITLHARRVGARTTIAGGFEAVPLATREGSGFEEVVPPGSYVAVITARDGHVVRDPVLLAAGERRVRQIRVPPRRDGLVFVPVGRFRTGYGGSEEFRTGFLYAHPEHDAEAKAFWIARTEVTWGDWIAYLRALGPEAARAYQPTFARTQNTVQLDEHAGQFVLSIRPDSITITAAEGEPLVYPSRDAGGKVRWERTPVTGVSYEDAVAYTAWLDRTQRVPGARVCTTLEWERAARGADGRLFPHGDTLAASDANFDETYRRIGFGPDEVGSFATSNSPFGVADMAGNVWEITRGRGDKLWLKGGSFYQDRASAMTANNNPGAPNMRSVKYGIRICAS